jgi:hypothetical protein
MPHCSSPCIPAMVCAAVIHRACCVALRCVAVAVALRCVALRCVACRCVALRCIASRRIVLCCVASCCVMLHCAAQLPRAAAVPAVAHGRGEGRLLRAGLRGAQRGGKYLSLSYNPPYKTPFTERIEGSQTEAKRRPLMILAPRPQVCRQWFSPEEIAVLAGCIKEVRPGRTPPPVVCAARCVAQDGGVNSSRQYVLLR